ncbi:alcohol dehydrogenase catalytic domain-containing protein [Burkholderia multivorans]|nr:alcohol dehydrogenase catalytic domain-containing protein [Burkholderia multivorans]
MGPYPARAYATATASSGLAPMQIQHRALQPEDVLIDVLCCGICHSDIHTARDEWNAVMPTA